MRRFALLILLFLALGSMAQAQAASPAGQSVPVLKGGYVRLDQWARASGFSMRWDSRSGFAELTSRTARLTFTANSRKAQLNGATLLLSLPVTVAANVVMVSAVDLQTTILPILSPYRNPSNTKVTTVCLDPGHGGKDTGKLERSNAEKRYTLLLAQEVAALLKIYNVKVVMTRYGDQTLELSDRAAFAQRKHADLFVSLHYNAAGREISGVEVHCMTPAGVASSNDGGGRSGRQAYAGNTQNAQNVLLAYEVQRNILRTTRLEDRGLKRSRFEVLREARMPAVLIEGGFMTNPSDAQKIYDSAFRKRMAQAIVDGIIAYKRTVERSAGR